MNKNSIIGILTCLFLSALCAVAEDHNPHGFTVWLTGAGVKRGFSYGATDEFGHKAVKGVATIYDLHANPSATKQELIRRAYYDLIGLPPSPAEVAAFVADKSPRAWENLIDHLLDSPHYG